MLYGWEKRTLGVLPGRCSSKILCVGHTASERRNIKMRVSNTYVGVFVSEVEEVEFAADPRKLSPQHCSALERSINSLDTRSIMALARCAGLFISLVVTTRPAR